MKTRKRILNIVLMLALPATALGAQVWRSDFNTDGDTDGVVVLKEGPPKAQISGPAGGFLTITDWDNATSIYTPDKAGRPIGATKGGSDSFSALYTFKWSTLNQDEVQAYELVGFMGNTSAQTRQVMGVVLRHWKVGGTSDHYVAVDVATASTGNTNFGYIGGPSTYLGTDPTAGTYQLAIGYDGATHRLSCMLFDGTGAALSGHSVDLDTDVPGLLAFGTANKDLELSQYALTHVGWSDYTGNLGDRATVWEVDWLALYDDATGAFSAVGPCADGGEPGAHGRVWQQTFNTGPGCIVDLFNGDTGKVMIGPAAGGRLQITSWDNTTNEFTPDKAGAPLGRLLTKNNSFSALYQFNWSALNQDEVQAYELVGFLGQLSPQTRQVTGAILRHWKVPDTTEHYVAIDLAFGTVGTSSSFGHLAGTPIFLGDSPTTQDYQLAIGFCSAAGTLKIELYDADGTLLGQTQSAVATLLGAGAQAEIDALALTHLGWSDYTGNGGNCPTVWQVDTLSFFDNFDGAFDSVNGVVPSDPQGACCMPDGVCADNQTEVACTGAGGTWQGGCVTCAASTCPLPPCGTPFADADDDDDVDMDDFGLFQECYTGAGQPIVNLAKCHCFDRVQNGSIDSVDFGKFRQCATQAGVPADPLCDGLP